MARGIPPFQRSTLYIVAATSRWLTDVKRYAIHFTHRYWIRSDGDGDGGGDGTMDGLMIWRQDSHMQRVYALIVVIYLYSVKSEQSRTRTRKVQARRGGGGGGKRSKRGMTTHSLLTWSRPPPVMPRHLTVTLYCLTLQSQRSGKVLRTTMNWRFMTDDCLLGVYISREISS